MLEKRDYQSLKLRRTLTRKKLEAQTLAQVTNKYIYQVSTHYLSHLPISP